MVVLSEDVYASNFYVAVVNVISAFPYKIVTLIFVVTFSKVR